MDFVGFRRKQVKILVGGTVHHGEEKGQNTEPTEPLNKAPPEKDTPREDFYVRIERYSGGGESADCLEKRIQVGEIGTHIKRQAA